MNLRSSTPNVSPTLNAMLIDVIIVATMYFAHEVLIPVALAGILSFMLAPLALRRTACSPLLRSRPRRGRQLHGLARVLAARPYAPPPCISIWPALAQFAHSSGTVGPVTAFVRAGGRARGFAPPAILLT
jgi:hypothetical protein